MPELSRDAAAAAVDDDDDDPDVVDVPFTARPPLSPYQDTIHIHIFINVVNRRRNTRARKKHILCRKLCV